MCRALGHGCLAVFGTLAPFALKYTLGLPSPLVPAAMFLYIGGNIGSLPFWLGLSRRVGKVVAWRYALLSNGLIFLPTLVVLHPDFLTLPLNARLAFGFSLSLLSGACAGATSMLAYSLMSDVIDAEYASRVT